MLNFKEWLFVHGGYRHHPRDKEELINAIKIEIDKQGPHANLGYIDTSKITDMSGLFMGEENFDADISNWNVSHVKDMSKMFARTKNINVDLSIWDTSSVRTMRGMFEKSDFKGDISHWNTSNVRDMSGLFMYSQFEDK